MGRLSKMPSGTRKKKPKRQSKSPTPSNEDEEASENEPQDSFAWKVLLPSQVKAWVACESLQELQGKISTTMELGQYEYEVKDACLLDYYVIALHWAKEKGFDERQISGFITLIVNLVDNIKEHQMAKCTNLKYLKECFAGVGLENPEIASSSLYFFSLDEAKLVMEYLIKTFFHHYALYEYVFDQKQDEMIIGADIEVEVFPRPPPLQESLPVDIYEQFVVGQSSVVWKQKLATEEIIQPEKDEFSEAVFKAVSLSNNEAVKTVTPSQLRKIIQKVTKDMIEPAQAKMQSRIRAHEAAHLSRISKMKVH